MTDQACLPVHHAGGALKVIFLALAHNRGCRVLLPAPRDVRGHVALADGERWWPRLAGPDVSAGGATRGFLGLSWRRRLVVIVVVGLLLLMRATP